MFLGFKGGITYVKMKKPCKKKSLASNWEEPFMSGTLMEMGILVKMKEAKFVC
jgi:hypothetical protein